MLCVTGSGYADATFGPITPPDYSALPKTLDGTQQQRDLKVKATLLRHGNWDSLNNAVIWDANIPDHTIPNSLYLTGKPSWWGVCVFRRFRKTPGRDGAFWPPE